MNTKTKTSPMTGSLESNSSDGYGKVSAAYTLIAIIFLVAVFRISASALSDLGFHGDEAQYWSWSQNLDWGYFTKPPMIAWIIRVTNSVCGDAEWCARSSSALLHSATSLICALIAGHVYNKKAGFWAGILFLTLPAVSFSSSIISTDVPLLFFWALALYSIFQVFKKQSYLWALMLGLSVGFGFLSKYAMGYFLLCTICNCIFFKEHRWFWKSPQLFIALSVACLVVSPNMIWNVSQNWVTVTHIADNANFIGDLFNINELLYFLLGQIGVFGPLLFGILIWTMITFSMKRTSSVDNLLLTYVIPILILVAIQAFISRANANWAATAYIGATVLVAGYLTQRSMLWIAKLSLVIHCTAAIIMAVYFLDLPNLKLPLQSDPLRKLRGWQETSNQVIRAMRDNPDRILLMDDRKTMASLIYGMRDHPWQPFIWDYDGLPNHHYELTARYVPNSEDQILLVAKWKNPHPILKKFSDVSFVGKINIPIGAGRARKLYLYNLANYVE